MSVAVVLVAAGRGERLGAGTPKALVRVAGVTLLEHAISRSIGTKGLTQLVIAATPGHQDEFLALASPHVPAGITLTVVTGGATRQQSIALALAEVDHTAEIVLVHDAARAFAPTEVFNRVVEEVRESGFGVVPVVAVHDTVKRAEGEEVLETVNRSELRVAQTPQGFPAQLLRDCYASVTEEHTDDASLVQSLGHRVLSVAGDRIAMKVTTQDDLILASHLVGGEQRTGIGTDTHRFSDDDTKPLYLGTILWEGERGLDGHSDGDALSHAIVDALLSAAGLGDIGSNFGVDRPEFSGANGQVFLEGALAKLHANGFSVINVSAQIIANRPKVAPMRERVEQALTAIIHAPITLSATTTDGLGFLGNTEGVAVVASALIQQAKK
ncbi:MAG: 2-C-methyl-D-erythritol 4-phosphate cytidylyltransferase [Rhodoluna sp.]|jgi:2-C-methyl-D-erythritol 4-phosphate cytidylyltransferase/2-C-methyl-D-erythritol 2,4-cyclodiphosphate synthase|nr:2-C-methyl-D-erythritol 4-phosphate cytidylyltransferase [Rhodoluna sp.]